MKVSERERKRLKYQTIVLPIIACVVGVALLVFIWTNALSTKPKTPKTSGEAFVVLQMQGYEPVDTKDAYLDQFADLNGSFQLITEDTELYYFETQYLNNADKIYSYFASEVYGHPDHSAGYKNYRYHDSHDNNEYRIVLQVESTVLFAKTTKEHTKDVQEYLVQLGYWDKTE